MKKIIAIILMVFACFFVFQSCSKSDTGSGKCDNCGRTAVFGGSGNMEFCADCFDSYVNYVFDN